MDSGVTNGGDVCRIYCSEILSLNCVSRAETVSDFSHHCVLYVCHEENAEQYLLGQGIMLMQDLLGAKLSTDDTG